MPALIFSSDAEADFRDSFNWYEQQRQGLGERFEEAVFSTLEKISESPEHYGKNNAGFRKILVPEFPFIIAFEADFEAGIIYVISVAHTSRDIRNRFRST